MWIAHNVKIEVFAYNEEKEDTKKGLLSLCPETVLNEINEGNIKIEEQVMKGKREEEKDITIYRLNLEKRKDSTAFVKQLLKNLNDENLENKLSKRIDESCKCYIRLDKKSLFKGEYKLIFGGDCFHIRIALAVFPKKKKRAKELLKETLNNSTLN